MLNESSFSIAEICMEKGNGNLLNRVTDITRSKLELEDRLAGCWDDEEFTP